MRLLDAWRNELRALLPGGFLRLDRGADAVFASDYPRHCRDVDAVGQALEEAGYAASQAGGVAHIDGTAEKYRAMMLSLPPAPLPEPTEDTLPLCLLAKRLLRGEGRETPLGPEQLEILRITAKCLDAGEPELLLRALPPMLAQMQRQKLALPWEAGRMMGWYLNHPKDVSMHN